MQLGRGSKDSLQDGLEDGRPEQGRGECCLAAGLWRESCHGSGWEPLGRGFPSVHLREMQRLPESSACPASSAGLPWRPLAALPRKPTLGFRAQLLHRPVCPSPPPWPPIRVRTASLHPAPGPWSSPALCVPGAGSIPGAGEAALQALRSLPPGRAGGRQPTGGLGRQAPLPSCTR